MAFPYVLMGHFEINYTNGRLFYSISKVLLIGIIYLFNCLYQYKFSASIFMGVLEIKKINEEENKDA